MQESSYFNNFFESLFILRKRVLAGEGGRDRETERERERERERENPKQTLQGQHRA